MTKKEGYEGRIINRNQRKQMVESPLLRHESERDAHKIVRPQKLHR